MTKELTIKILIMFYTAITAVFISQHIHDSCDVFVLGLHILACYLYSKEVIKLTNLKNYLKLNKNHNKKIQVELFEKTANQELTLTKLFKK